MVTGEKKGCEVLACCNSSVWILVETMFRELVKRKVLELASEARQTSLMRPEGLRSMNMQTRGCKNGHYVRRRLERLETAADQKPGDALAQAEFLRELGKTHPSLVVQRVESEQFASNEAVFKEYVKALIATRRLDQTAVYDMMKVITIAEELELPVNLCI